MGARRLALTNILSLCSLAAVATLSVCASVASADGRGQLQVPEKSFNFGSVLQGKKVSHAFTVRNVGKGDLQILGTTPSCGCTVASVSSPTLKAGESGTITVDFDTSGFSGPKTKTVEILTSDSPDSGTVVSLVGTVLPGVAVQPKVLEFGRLPSSIASDVRQKQFVVKLPAGVSVSSAQALSLHVELAQLSGAAGEAAYAVTLKPGIPKGPFRDRVTLAFSDSTLARVNVPLVALVESDIVVKPGTLSFGVVSGDKPLERRVSFEYRAKGPLTIKQVSSSDSAVSAYYQPGKQGMNGTIVVQVNPKKVKGDLKATVEVSTSHPSEPLTYINVFATTPPA